MKKIVFIILGLFSLMSSGQTLTISDSGETGTSGTNWTTTGTDPVTISATGNASINTAVIEGYLNTGVSVLVRSTNGMITQAGNIEKTAGADATLTIRSEGSGRINNTANYVSTSGKLNLVFWSDYNNTNGGGSTFGSTVSNMDTNGGHFWAGGSSSPAGTAIWNGLTVGNGPSVDASGSNQNALDFHSVDLNTGGGDALFWAGNGTGSGLAGIEPHTSSTISTGSGDIILISDDFDAVGALTLNTTGKLVLAPNGGSYSGTITWQHDGGTNLDMLGTFDDITINNMASVSGLSIGFYDGMSGVTIDNSSNVAMASATTIAGPITVYGGEINIDADLSSTATTANGITIVGQRILQDDGIDVTTLGADIDYTAANFVSSGGEILLSILGNGTNRAILNANGGDITLAASYGAGGLNGGAQRAITFTTADMITSGSGAVSITGDASLSGNTINTAWGMQPNDAKIITDSGDITLTMTGGAATNNSRGLALDINSMQLLSASGTITIRDLEPAGLTGVYTGLYLRPNAANTILFGANGAEVASSSSNIVIEANRVTFDVRPTRFNTSGTLTIRPVGAIFGAGISTANVNVESIATGFTLGKPGNSSALTLARTSTINGSIKVYGGNIAVNENLNTTAEGAAGNILLKASGNIVQAEGKSITTNGADITLWSNSDEETTNGGYIYLQDNTSLDTRTSSDRTANDGTANDTSGGTITLGGGSGTTVPTGYALNVANSFRGGINLGTESGNLARHDSNITIISGGGNISLKGRQTSVYKGDAAGINAYEGFLLDAGQTGNIALEGNASGSNASYSDGMNLGNYATTAGGTASYIRTVDGDITLTGSASNAKTHSRGLTLAGGGAGLSIQCTGTGNINLLGTPGGSGDQYNILLIGANILANSGDINLTGASTGRIFNANYGSTIGYKSGSEVISSTSDITVTGDNFVLSSGFNFNTAGTLAIASFGNSFTNTFNTTQLTYSSDLTGLTIGKSTNTSTVIFDSATSIAGPITVYGGDIELNATLTATGSNLNLHATGSVTQTAAITANNLALSGTGNFTLQNSSNNIHVLAGGDATTPLGNIAYRDADALEIGTVNPTGIFATGTVLVETETGNLTLSESINTTSTSDDAIILNAGKSEDVGTGTGGDIVVSGNPTLTYGTGGRAKLFSGRQSTSTGLTSLVGGNPNIRSEVDETTITFSPVLADDNAYALFRIEENTAPTVTNAIADFAVDEDAANSTFDLTDVFSDVVDNDADLVYTVTSNSTTGLVDVSVDNTTDELTLDYLENQNGTATVVVRATDSGSLFVEDTFVVTVNAVNDNPEITGLPTDITVTEDVVSNLDLSAANVTDVDAGSSTITLKLNVDAGTLSATDAGGVTVTGSGTGVMSLNGTVVDIDTFLNTPSNLKYQSVSNANGDNAAILTLVVNDNGNTGSGGGTDITLGTVNIDITAVNDPVTVTTNTGITVAEGGTEIINNTKLNTTDADDSGTGLIYTVTTLPINGTLQVSSSDLALNGTFTQADIDNGVVQYVHDDSNSTTDSFGFSVADGGEDGVSAVTGQTMAITITPVDDDPPAIYETGTANAISNITFAISTPENETALYDFDASEDVNWSISGTNASLFSINGNGEATYSVAPDFETASGPFVFTVTATDLSGNKTEQNVSASVTNVMEAGVVVTLLDGVLEENETAGAAYNGSFSIVLSAVPTAEVEIPLTSSDTSEGTVQASVVFTPSNWDTPQIIEVVMVDDSIGDGAVSFTIETASPVTSDLDYGTLTGADIEDVTMTTQNNDPPGIVARTVGSSINTAETGSSVDIAFELLSQPLSGASVTIPLSISDDSEASVSVGNITISNVNWNQPENNVVTVTGLDDTDFDGDIQFTLITGNPTSSDPNYDALVATDVIDVILINQDDEADTDGDGIEDSVDDDDDNDGFTDVDEVACGTDPLDHTSVPLDTDTDTIPDCIDTDDDNDGTPDSEDAFPLDPDEDTDTDGDGMGNNADDDDDNDGTPDSEDAFPLDENEDTDTDADGTGDNADTDDDNDGTPDSEDDFPLNPNEDTDTDGDGMGNNADDDDDNDGIPDTEDAFPLDADDSKEVPVEKTVIPAEALTPNGDGINDTWVVPGIENYPNNVVRIYNRWGHQVFETATYKNDWAGFNKGNRERLPAGSYLFIINLGNGSAPIQGWVFLNY